MPYVCTTYDESKINLQKYIYIKVIYKMSNIRVIVKRYLYI